jgi:hypothetical protein
VTRTMDAAKFRMSVAGILATLYMAGIIITAWTKLDLAWDSLAYHLPFAAIRAGLVTYADYVVPEPHRLLLDGFPPVLDYIKGSLWKVTGRVEATQLFNALIVLSGTFLLHRLYGMRPAVVVLAVLAIPVGQVEFAGNYTDLPVNFLLAFSLFSSVHALVSPTEHGLRHGAAAAVALCMATTFKVTAIPFSLVIWGLYVLTAGFMAGSGTGLAKLRRESLGAFFAFAGVGGVVAFGYGAVNMVALGNPLFPVPIQLGPITLPGTIPPSNWNAAAYLADVPRAFRWLVSVTEWHAFDYRSLPYVVSQGDVPESAKSYRMGGLFFCGLMISAGFLGILRRRLGTTLVLKVAGLHLVMALITSVVPGSHEMRYFFFWYLSLIWATFYLLASKLEDRDLSSLYVAVVAACALYVTMITGARYVYPFSDRPGAEQLAGSAIRAELRNRLASGEYHLCVLDKDPYGFLYSRPFHPDVMPRVKYQVSMDVSSSACQPTQPLR